MKTNPAEFPNCYLTTDCYLICKGESGDYELPGVPLAQQACYQMAEQLAREAREGRETGNEGRNGLGLLNWDLPTFGMNIDWDKIFNKLSEMFGISPEDLRKIAKVLLIAGIIVLLLVILKNFKRK